jgi:phenylacetate-CoA ligase
MLKVLLKKRFGKELSEIENVKSEKDLLMFEEEYLKALLLHAYHNVKYYNVILNEVGIIENDEVDLRKFDNIPILTKSIIRQYGEKLVSNDYMTRKWYYNASGGSTGEPVKFIQDDVYSRWAAATFYYYYKHMLGIEEPIVRKVILWGSERDIFQGGLGWKVRLSNWLSNTVFLNSFRMTEDDMGRYLTIINSYKPDLIRGYAGSLYELCRYAKKRGIKMHTPKAVVSTAETLMDKMREEIEDAFGTKVYDFYGSRETNNLAGECKEGLLHIFVFHNYIEVLDSYDRPVKEGEEGRIIVTNLHNYSMPFIRYEIGDMAILGPKKCKCGSLLPTLKKITGRITDHFVKKDGTVIHGEYFTHLFYFKDWVKAFQVVQEDYQKIRILVVLKNKVNEHEKKDIENKVKLVMGWDCQVVWEFVDDIPKTPQGKHLYTLSKVWRR